MKKISTLLFALFTCIGLISAQGVNVSVIVVDDNGASVNGAAITMYATTCDSVGYYNTGTTNPNGYWSDSFTGCSQGAVDVTVSCPDGTTQTASGFYDPNNTTLSFTVTCGGSTGQCSGYISSTMGASLGQYDFSLVGSNTPVAAYSWDFGDGNNSTEVNPSYTYTNSGLYGILLVTSDNAGNACTYYDSLYVELASDSTCNAYFQWSATAADPYTLEFYSSAQGGTAPYTYSWDFGDNSIANTANPVHTYANEGTYVVTLTVTDADGNNCTSTYVVTVYGPMPQDTCYDWSVIDFGANCPGVDEVCGCDGITYQNECIALNCFGIIDWTAGPCDGNGNGGGGTPIDSCNYNVTVGFQYTSTAALDFEFWGAASGGNLPFDYYWDFGDGTTATGDNVTHTFATDSTGQDSILAYTVCLTALEIDSTGCGATACETIVISVDPIGNFAGVIVEGANLQGGTGQVEKVTGPGDPMEGVEVLLLDAAGLQIGTSTTNAQGEYAFDDLHFGNYVIKVNIPGITHDGEYFKLTPVVQTVPALDFVVTSTEVTTGIEATTFINTFEVMPNPTFGRVNLTIGMTETMDIQMTVTNLVGQAVMNQSLNLAKGEQTINLDLAGQAAGIYLVSLRSGKEVITKKIVKQ